MNILLLGPDTFTREWLDLLAGHTVASSQALPADPALLASCDAVFELWLDSPERKLPLLRALEKSLPPAALIFTNTVCVSLAELAAGLADPFRVAGIGFLPTFSAAPSVEICFTPGAPEERRNAAKVFLAAIGREMEIVADGVGMVFPRILSMIVNEAYFALQQGVAEEAAIDTAMQLATNYPHGPFEWAERIGLKNLLLLLDALQKETGDDRYRASTLLRRRARAIR